MCTNLEKSALSLFELFDESSIPEAELYKKISDKGIVRFSFSGSLRDFIRALIFDGDIEISDGKYKITEQGRAELRNLKGVCSV